MLLRILAAVAVAGIALALAWVLSGAPPAQQAAFASADRGAKHAARRGKAVMPAATLNATPAPLELAVPKQFETASFALG